MYLILWTMHMKQSSPEQVMWASRCVAGAAADTLNRLAGQQHIEGLRYCWLADKQQLPWKLTLHSKNPQWDSKRLAIALSV